MYAQLKRRIKALETQSIRMQPLVRLDEVLAAIDAEAEEAKAADVAETKDARPVRPSRSVDSPAGML